SISWWAFWSASHCLITNYVISLSCARIGHMTVLLIPVLFVHFLYLFLEKPEKKYLKILILAGYFLSFFFALSSLGTDWILESVRPKLGFLNFMEPGSLYNFLTLLFGFYTTFGLFFLFQSTYQSKGLKKKQLVYLSVGSIIGYVFGSSNFFPIYDLVLFPFPYGSLGITAFCLIFAYAILKYRLMNIDVILKKTLIFTGLFASVMVIVTVTTSFIQSPINDYVPLSGTFATVLSVCLAMFLYDPVQRLLAHLTDRFLFQKKFNYHKLLEDASRGISKIRSLDRLAKLIVLFLVSRGKIQNAAVFVRDDETRSFVLKAGRGYPSKDTRPRLALKDTLAKFLEKEKGIGEIKSRSCDSYFYRFCHPPRSSGSHEYSCFGEEKVSRGLHE
ncbi:MAG: hypothetical protein HZC17_07745, partial [Candidatus Omnitrophica bacterium]|nr:hypothetical protein [Candidatus Omnitrophota bacterium]